MAHILSDQVIKHSFSSCLNSFSICRFVYKNIHQRKGFLQKYLQSSLFSYFSFLFFVRRCHNRKMFDLKTDEYDIAFRLFFIFIFIRNLI